MSGCRHCGDPLAPSKGHARIWCSIKCKYRATRKSKGPKVHRLDCEGCGEPMPEQTGDHRGALYRYHHECQVVRRAWSRQQGKTLKLERYHALKRAGMTSALAQIGSTGRISFNAALEMAKERQ